MNHTQHKFLTTSVVFLMMVIGVFLATRFNDIDLGAMNLVLLLVNSLLLLIILGIILHLKEGFGGAIKGQNKKRVDINVG